MKKRGTRLMVLCCVLIACVGGYLLIRQSEPVVEDETQAGPVAEAVESMDPEAVYAMNWDYMGEQIKLEKAGDAWQYAQDEAFPLEQAYAETMLAQATSLTASQRIDGVDDMSEYGLVAPQMEIILTDANGNNVRYSIGDQNSLSGEYYMQLGDDNSTVWVVPASLYNAFSYTLYNLIDMEDIPEMSGMQAVTIARETGDMDIEYIEDNEGLSYTDAYHWFVKDGDTYLPADEDKVITLYSQLMNLSWVECVTYSATEEDLAAYGLKEPAAEVTLRYAEGTFTLALGAYKTGSTCYAMIPGSSMVYTIDASVADAFLLADYGSVRPDDILAIDWDTVSSFEVTLDGATHEVTYLGSEERTDEEDVTTTTYQYVEGETALDGQAVRAMLEKVSSLYASGVKEDAQSRGEVISFVFHRDAAVYPEITLAFHQYDSSSYLVAWNGERGQLVSKSSVDSICALVPELFEAAETAAE